MASFSIAAFYFLMTGIGIVQRHLVMRKDKNAPVVEN